ncbi:hypothetical protein BKA70DRAFT_1433887 [Coprinopsis sp. MPI-PUGE-AT-0042]|nr:hypothetical protein BKA70DRAFT_1433887 [Coprinopsis sp. MPI-PUGE-AT-0042]
MPILSGSLLPKLDLHAHGPKAEGTAGEYEGQMDSAWNIGTYVHTNIQCFNEIPTARWFVQFFEEAKTSHIGLLHISAYFLCPSSSKVSFAVKVTSLKVGKGFTNPKANLMPEPSLGPTKLPQTEDLRSNLPHPTPAIYLCTLVPPESRIRPVFGESAKHEYTSWALGTQTLAKNQPSYAPRRTNAESVGRLGLEWAAWYEFQKEPEALGDVYIPLLVDMFNGSVGLLPSEERELGNTWEPTMTLSIDFKFPISELGLEHSKRAIGLYSAGKFVNHPQSRHEVYVEVWTAPSEAGKGSVEEG